MSVILDTGPLVAWLNRADPLHERADGLLRRVFRHEHGLPLSTDTVLDEGLTFLRARVGRRETSEDFARFFFPGTKTPLLDWLATGQDVLAEAKRLHLDHFERALSFTDCTLVVHAQRTGSAVATFDRGFGGLVPVVDG